MAQIYFPGWVGESYSDIKAHLSISQTWLDLDLDWAWQNDDELKNNNYEDSVKIQNPDNLKRITPDVWQNNMC